MKPPNMVCGKYEVRYRQIPYEDRYFFIYHKGHTRKINELARIRRLCVNSDIDVFWFLKEPVEHEIGYRFLERVKKYDKYLDSKD
jgi:hypothetical protein